MPAAQLNRVGDYIRRIALLHEGKTLSDAQLLGHFIDGREDAAFSTLVRRHGPMVLGVCRRILGNQHDAEDAFQATFLVLVLKAASIKPRQMVGNWLYGVAYQTAVRARSATARRRRREKQVTNMAEPQANSQELWNDLQPLLDQELSRLPDKYRSPIVLCDLEGKSRKEAARQLGWPEGTVSGRLSRARAILAKRLTKHGLALSAGSLAAAMSQHVASASMPALLASTTSKAAMLVATGQIVAATALSAKVAILTKGVMKTMLLAKLKTTSTVVLAMGLMVGVAGVGGGVLVPGTGTRVAEGGEGTSLVAGQGEQAKTDMDRLQGKWRAVSGQRFGEDLSAEILPREGILWGLEFEKDKVVTLNLKTERPEKSNTPYLARLFGGGPHEFKLNESQTPKEIDFPKLTFDARTEGMKAIYELDGDTLKICWNEPPLNKERPKEMKGTGPSRVMVVFQRPSKKTTTMKERIGQLNAELRAEADKKLMQGTWYAVSGLRFGEELSTKGLAAQDIIIPTKLEFSGDSVDLSSAVVPNLNPKKGQLEYAPHIAKTGYRIDPTSKPKEIDWLNMNGIYELDGDTLRICWNDPATKVLRPEELSGKGKNQVLVVYQRQKTKTDQELLQGTWKAVKLEITETIFGKNIPGHTLVPNKLEFAENTVVLTRNQMRNGVDLGYSKRGDYKLNPAKQPKEIDWPYFPAIYELNGDTLKVCWNEAIANGERPKDFAGIYPSQFMVEYERQKEQKEPQTFTDLIEQVKKNTEARAKNKQLQGQWSAVSAERYGANLPKDDLKDHPVPWQVDFNVDKLTLYYGDINKGNICRVLDAPYQIEAGKKFIELDLHPKTISGTAFGAFVPPSIVPKGGFNAIGHWKWILELEGESLKICLHEPVTDRRPTEMSGTGPNRYVVRYERRKEPLYKDLLDRLQRNNALSDLAEAKQKKILQGKWIATHGQRFGEELSEAALAERDDVPFWIEFEKDLVSSWFGKAKDGIRHEIHKFGSDYRLGLKKPMEIDWLNKRAIYQVDGDTLKLCWYDPPVNEERPTEFSGTGPNRFLVVYKKQKAQLRLRPDRTEHDFGVLARGKTVEHTFKIVNESDVAVKFSAVRVSCGCLTSMLSHLALQPDEAAELRVTLDTRRFEGPKDVTIYVSAESEGAQTECKLLVSADSKEQPAAQPQEKTHHFEFAKAPWGQVLDWYSDISGLAFTGKDHPKGTLNFRPPQGKKFTVNEITDILNESLLARPDPKLLILRGANTYTLVAADQNIDVTLTPRVPLDELHKKAKTDLVVVSVPLTNLKAKDMVGAVKKLLGPFGHVFALEKSNELLLRDTTATLRNVHAIIQDIEHKRAKK